MKTYGFIHVLKKPTRCTDKYVYVIDPLSFMFQILKTVDSFGYTDISLSSGCSKIIKAICMWHFFKAVQILWEEMPLLPCISAAHSNF